MTMVNYVSWTEWMKEPGSHLAVFQNHEGEMVAWPYDKQRSEAAEIGVTRAPDSDQYGRGADYKLIALSRDMEFVERLMKGSPDADATE